MAFSHKLKSAPSAPGGRSATGSSGCQRSWGCLSTICPSVLAPVGPTPPPRWYGPGSHYVNLAPDDVHNPSVVRFCHPFVGYDQAPA